MSGEAHRATLAAIGRDMAGDRGSRRAAALSAVPTTPPPTTFTELMAVPDWLRWSPAERDRLARLVALRSMAPVLAASIDGAWLGAMAEAVGEQAIDWAIAKGAAEPHDGTGHSPEDLAARGFAILAAELPPSLRYYLPGHADVAPAATPSIVADAVAFARADPA